MRSVPPPFASFAAMPFFAWQPRRSSLCCPFIEDITIFRETGGEPCPFLKDMKRRGLDCKIRLSSSPRTRHSRRVIGRPRLPGVDPGDGEISAFSMAGGAGSRGLAAGEDGSLEKRMCSRGLAVMTAQAGRGCWPQRREELPRSHWIGHSSRPRQLVRVVYVALGAIAPVAGKKHFFIGAKDPEGSIDLKVTCQLFPGMPPVNQESEVNRCWKRTRRYVATSRARAIGIIHHRRVVAKNAVLVIEPTAAMHRQLLVAHVALAVHIHHLAPGASLTPAHAKVEHGIKRVIARREALHQ